MATTKKAAKQKARVQKSGKRLIKASVKKAKKSTKNFSASSGKKYAKKVTLTQTAANYEKEGKKRVATGKVTVKKKNLKVTPRSAAKKIKAEEAGYNSRKKM